MPRKRNPAEEGCCPTDDAAERYEVEGVATVDERGQMVIPKAIRDKAGIKAGDKLAIVTLTRDGRVCCLHLFRSDELASKVKGILAPNEG